MGRSCLGTFWGCDQLGLGEVIRRLRRLFLGIIFWGEDEAFVLEGWGAEVEEEGAVVAGGFEVVDNLRFFFSG